MTYYERFDGNPDFCRKCTVKCAKETLAHIDGTIAHIDGRHVNVAVVAAEFTNAPRHNIEVIAEAIRRHMETRPGYICTVKAEGKHYVVRVQKV